MRKKSKLTDYKNFWLIWINCAGRKEGVSLFNIQIDWNVKTNYLYHNEVGLGNPLFRSMIRENYITKEGKRLKAKFEWVPEFIREKYEVVEKGDLWFPDYLLRIKWGAVQKFIEKYHTVLLDIKNIKLLYKNDRELIGKSGSHIFTDIFLYVLFSNLRTFCKRYEADVVLRIISTLISLSTDRDLLNYIHRLDSELGKVSDFPVLVKDENELSKILCVLKW
ncbi:MAG: hypothetical protein V3U72_04590 [Candidatus Aenigmarchaeota archaeon]